MWRRTLALEDDAVDPTTGIAGAAGAAGAAGGDLLALEEPDEQFSVAVDRTLDGRFVLLKSILGTGDCVEVAAVDTATVDARPVVVAPRRPEVWPGGRGWRQRVGKKKWVAD